MNPLQFEIQYECLQNLANGASRPRADPRAQPPPRDPARRLKPRAVGWHRPARFSNLTSPPGLPSRPPDLEWKLTYVGSAESDAHDQVLDTVLVGPVGVGSYKFVFQADPPDVTKIPNSDILGVTVLLLTCSYNDTEFIRVGYYVNNEYADEELREEPPATVRLDRVVRNILAEKPRVTRFPCEFDAVSIPTADAMDDEEGIENQVPGTGMMGDGCVPGEAGTMAAGAHAGFGYAGVPAGQGLAEMRY